VVFCSFINRLFLQGLDPEAEYEITEPLPNNMSQAKGNLRITEDAGAVEHILLYNYLQLSIRACVRVCVCACVRLSVCAHV
jgi:hypothetical protein